jgi:hypothetical protein
VGLNTTTGVKSFAQGEYVVEIENLSPYPEWGNRIKGEEYLAAFIVTKGSGVQDQ